MTVTTLYGQASQAATASGAGNPGTNGIHFNVSTACTLQGIWHYSPSGFSQTQLPTSIGLYNYTTQALIHSETVSSWSGAAGSGWVYAAFSSPPSLSPGTEYMAVQFRNDAVNGWFVLSDAFSWPSANGILTAPADVGAGQGWYVLGTTLAFPTTQLAGYSWLMDVQVSTGTAHATTASLTVTPVRSAGRSLSGNYGTPVLDSAGNGILDSAGVQVLDTRGSASASLTVAPSLSAAARNPRHSRTASLTVTPVRTAGTANASTRTASLTVTPSRSASGTRAGLVQETSGSTTGTSLTLTFPAATTAGNSVIVAVCGYFGGTVSTITLSGGGGGSFTQAAASGSNNAQVWAHLGSSAPSASVTVTTTTAGILAWAYEVAGNVAFDVSAASAGTGTSWSSTATGTTVPFQHFVVGLGTVVSNAGSITGPGGAWTSETAITNVVGAGGHAIGGVSGYQQPASSGTYTYSGTSGTSSAWGAVTAAFLVVPFIPGASINSIWGGYAFYEHAVAGYTGITATFTIPTVSGGVTSSIWIGLGNVYQCGIYQTYNTGFPGNSQTRPWSWWLPGAGEDWNAATFPTAAGDTLTLTMQLTSTEWLMTIQNHTEGWSYTEAKSVLAVNVGSIQNLGAGPAQWPYPVGQAEVIIEREGVPLPHYGSVAFSSITTTPPATQLPSPVFAANSTIDQYPGAYNLAAGSFSMHWNAES